MANAYTDTTALSNLARTAYDRYVEFALRSVPQFRTLADKKPVQQAMPGTSIVFEQYEDLAKQTTELTETVDPDAVAVPNTNETSVTLREYGNSELATRKLRVLSLSDVDPALANLIAYNMNDSIDEIVSAVLRAGTNVLREAGGARSTTAAITDITATDYIKSRDVRFIVAKLRAASAQPRNGDLFYAGIHPEVSVDLMEETGAAAWRDPHNYSGASAIWAGEVGVYQGAFFVESPRLHNAVDGGTGGNTVRVFRTIFAGRQALAEAVAVEPGVVVGPITDKLNRFRPIGWYALAGWSRYREEALWRLETTSSIDDA